MAFNEDNKWELVHNQLFTQNIKEQRGKMETDYHYAVGRKFPFYFKDVEQPSATQVKQKDNKRRSQMLTRFKHSLTKYPKAAAAPPQGTDHSKPSAK